MLEFGGSVGSARLTNESLKIREPHNSKIVKGWAEVIVAISLPGIIQSDLWDIPGRQLATYPKEGSVR
jgi:hypothetical protein